MDGSELNDIAWQKSVEVSRHNFVQFSPFVGHTTAQTEN